MELVSVVVAIYNQEDFLRELITSICKQSYCALQIILVDDGSTDHSPAICDEYGAKDERILVIHKENGGVSSARNAGLLAAEGKYIFVLDGDDILTPDYCARMVEAQQANPDSFVLCGYEEFDEKVKHLNSIEYAQQVVTNSINTEIKTQIDEIEQQKEERREEYSSSVVPKLSASAVCAGVAATVGFTIASAVYTNKEYNEDKRKKKLLTNRLGIVGIKYYDSNTMTIKNTNGKNEENEQNLTK